MLYRENGQFKTTYRADQQIFPIAQDRFFMLALLALAFVVVPLTASDYLFRAILIPFVIMSLAALGVNILVGYCGQISLGSGAFMAVGAYGAYNFFARIPGMPLIPTLILGGLCATAFGILFGLPSLRVKGLYLAVATLAAQFFADWMAIRDMDVAAAVIGIRPMYAKLSAFAVSSFIIGVAGALWAFFYLGAWEPGAFSVDLSFKLLFMVIIGGLGSIMGSFFGAAFIVILPIALNQFLPFLAGLIGRDISTTAASHAELMIFGGLIVWFLIVEPHGLAKLWSTAKQKLRLWPFPH